MVWFTRYARPSRHQGPAASWRDSARVSGSPSRPGYQTNSVSQNSFIKFLRQFLSLAKFCFQFFFLWWCKTWCIFSCSVAGRPCGSISVYISWYGYHWGFKNAKREEMTNKRFMDRNIILCAKHNGNNYDIFRSSQSLIDTWIMCVIYPHD